MKNDPLFLVGIGTSAGGHAAVAKLVEHLDPLANAAYCVVIHLSDYTVRSTLPARLQLLTKLICVSAENGMTIKKGHIYIAQPGRHLLVKEGKLAIGYGPEENNYRPSINVLFRSIAVAYSSRAIAVLLTGLLNDGTAGLEAIKQCGGTLIVQDPEEAEYPEMPRSAIGNLKVDHILTLSKMGAAISAITKKKVITKKNVPETIRVEARRSETMAAGIEGMEKLGMRSPYGCPDCGGVLWEMSGKGRMTKYRCHTGHVYSQSELVLKQTKESETAIWVAIRMMEERKHLLLKIASEFVEKKSVKIADAYTVKAELLKDQIEQIKTLLTAMENSQQ